MPIRSRSKIYVFCLSFLLASFTIEPSAGTLALETVPLFTTNSVKPAVLLSIDDSGSMDFEVLFDSVDGNLWWNLLYGSFVDQSDSDSSNWKLALNGDRRFVYLFPNGSGTGRRAFGDNDKYFAIPPTIQFAFARSSAYNKMYYNPNVTYEPWVDNDTSDNLPFGNIDKTAAPSDKILANDPNNGDTVDLTQDPLKLEGSDYEFLFPKGSVVPAGTEIYDQTQSGWNPPTAADTLPLSTPQFLAVAYHPATYYVKLNAGNYQIAAEVGTISGNCADLPDPRNYAIFEKQPSALSGVDSLGPDGSCLQKIAIQDPALGGSDSYAHNGSRRDCASTTGCTYAEEIQNFANWYGYYRKRHLAVRGGMGLALNSITGIRTGLFRISDLSNAITMRDLQDSASHKTFYSDLYNIGGNPVVERSTEGNSFKGTPNRAALDFAGKQFDSNTSIILEACQKNFTLAVTDGFTTAQDISGIGNFDGAAGNPYEDSFPESTFADVAMKYYQAQFRTADFTTQQVPTPVGCNATPIDPQLDCAKDLHMNTFAVGLGGRGQSIFGITDNNGVTRNIVADAYPDTDWIDVSGDQDNTQIDDLYHGAVNGRGEMYNASAPQELASKLSSAVQGIQAKVGVASAVTFNTATLETNSAVYLAFFNSANWSGDLVSFALDGRGNVDLNESWSAASLLDNAVPPPSSRFILTYNGSYGLPFDTNHWNELSSGQTDDLNMVPGASGMAGLDFIRGDRTLEGPGSFRVRGSVLGDVVHSSPVFVGKPSLFWPDTDPFPTTAPDRYLDFKTNLIGTPREEMVYFGSNDGVLHGVRARDGQEMFAYIPQNLFSTNTNAGLHYLADPQYQHRYYVDLAPTISDVYIDIDGSGPGGNAWHTILIGAERGGGRGIFALDVTNPDNFTEANAADLVLWEFSQKDVLGNLGFTYSRPTIAMLENGRWAAIFGNGYNGTGDGLAKLLIVFIDGGLDGIWTDGSSGSNLDYMIISTGVGFVSTPNGLATPAVVDVDGNGAADRVYAGDLLGNLWAFDLSDASTLGSPNTKPAWKVAFKSGTTLQPLFVAKSASNTVQPITSKPAVVFHPDPPSGSNTPNVLVFFGTGKYLEQTDISNIDSQSFYGVWDDGTGNLNRSNLVQQTLTSGSFTDSDGNTRTDLRLITDTVVNYTQKHGWYIDLNLILGERVVVDPIVRGDLVFFNTWIPDDDACSSGGIGYLMSVAQLNGGEPDTPAFAINGDQKVDEKDTVNDGTNDHAAAGQTYVNGLPAQSTFLSNKQYTPGTGSKVIETRDVVDVGGPGTGRLSWEQLSDN